MSSFDSIRTGPNVPYNYAAAAPSPTMLHYPASNSRPNAYSQHQEDTRSMQLFDPQNSERPHPSLMTHFIQVFFEKYGSDFSFLSYQEAISDFWEQRMSLIVANCIAAIAVKCVKFACHSHYPLTITVNPDTLI